MRHAMMALAAAAAVAGALAAGAAEAKKAEPPKDPFAAKRAARAAFEKENGGAFAKAKLCAFEATEDALRFDRPAGAGKWAIVLPYSNDSRVRFIDAEFAGGKYAKGQVKVLGFPAKDLSAAEFAALRKDFPMAGVKLGQGEAPKATFYPAESAPAKFKGSHALTVDGRGTLLGALGGSLGRFGIDASTLAYKVTFRGADGLVVGFGVKAGGIPAAEATPTLREALEQREPARKGCFNERDIVDCFEGGWFEYAGAMPPPPPEKKDAKK